MKKIQEGRSLKPVAIWLLVGVFMIIIQIILGGITRLTDSGLSITEWKPILGTLPPMNDQEWDKAFEKYKQIAQFKQVHFYFSIEDFKSIYFWEWLHRNWGKLIGIVFIIPFLIFLRQKRIHASMIKPLLILFLLGGLQGLIGWIMVQSGLNEENLYVSHIRLCVHFLAALLLLAYCFWFAMKLYVPPKERTTSSSLKNFTIAILIILIIQLAYGAFMAGLRAAIYAPTWPDMNGNYLPENFLQLRERSFSFFSSLVNNQMVVQFIHRNLAYLIFILIIVWVLKASKIRGSVMFNRIKWLPLVLVIVQMLLGIFSLLTSPKKLPQEWGLFEWNALGHQFVAMMLLLSLILILYLLNPNKKLNQANT